VITGTDQVLNGEGLNKLAPLTIFATIALVIVLVGCVQTSAVPQTTPHTNSDGLSGAVTEAGSTTVQPLAEKLASAFIALYPEVKVTVQGGGSSVGIKAATDGTVDIGAASRELKPDERQLVTHLLAHSGLAVITHPSNTLTGLTMGDLRRIFAGEIESWNEIGGPDDDVIVVAREEGSGTRGTFETTVMEDYLITDRAILMPASGAIRNVISLTPGSIGFVAFGYVDDTVKALAIDGIQASDINVTRGAYKLSQPLYFLTKGRAKGLANEFIQFCLSSDRQSIVQNEGYVSVKLDGA
jgi:phosphate transport system substrate-binding protein